MNPTFLKFDQPLLTVMVQAKHPDRIKELIDQSLPEGAEAFGMQFEQMDGKYRNCDTYRSLFSYARGKPVYATNYRTGKNEGKSDEQLAEELMELASSGAVLVDVMGDYFDRQPGELTINKAAIKKQMKLIESLHKIGAEVLMSSHICTFISWERVLEIALEHQRRGADICKIVTGADTMEQQLENLKIIHMLKKNLKIPFLFLSAGECHLLRRIGGELGCCMYLCVHEYDGLTTPFQPLLKDIKAIRDHMQRRDGTL